MILKFLLKDVWNNLRYIVFYGLLVFASIYFILRFIIAFQDQGEYVFNLNNKLLNEGYQDVILEPYYGEVLDKNNIANDLEIAFNNFSNLTSYASVGSSNYILKKSDDSLSGFNVFIVMGELTKGKEGIYVNELAREHVGENIKLRDNSFNEILGIIENDDYISKLNQFNQVENIYIFTNDFSWIKRLLPELDMNLDNFLINLMIKSPENQDYTQLRELFAKDNTYISFRTRTSLTSEYYNYVNQLLIFVLIFITLFIAMINNLRNTMKELFPEMLVLYFYGASEKILVIRLFLLILTYFILPMIGILFSIYSLAQLNLINSLVIFGVIVTIAALLVFVTVSVMRAFRKYLISNILGE